MRVLIVDQHVLFREGLASLLNGQPDFEVIGEAGSAESAVEKTKKLQPDLVLFDPALSDENSLAAIENITSNCPETKIVILSMQESDTLLFETIRAGADGYLLKSMPISALLASLRATQRGEAAISRRMAARILDEFRRLSDKRIPQHDGFERLTEREMEILIQLGKGISNLEIAQELFISENTVKVHVHNILDKLDLRNRREAYTLARDSGLVRSSGENYSSNGHSKIQRQKG